jgi:predicted GIY-YIG superfamily endonuclease
MAKSKLNPKGHTVYIMAGADGSYYTGMCVDLGLELKRVAKGEIRHFKNPARFPVTVAFKEEKLPFREALLKCKYLRNMNKIYRKKLIDTKVWPAGKILEPLILEKVKEHLEKELPE